MCDIITLTIGDLKASSFSLLSPGGTLKGTIEAIKEVSSKRIVDIINKKDGYNIEVSFKTLVVTFIIPTFNRKYEFDFPFLISILINDDDIHGFSIIFANKCKLTITKNDLSSHADNVEDALFILSGYKYPIRYDILFRASILRRGNLIYL